MEELGRTGGEGESGAEALLRHVFEELHETFAFYAAALTDSVDETGDRTTVRGDDVAGLAERVALRMGLTHAEARDARHVAKLRDVGKIAVPTEILLKPAPLTDVEWELMCRHVVVGGELVVRLDAFAHLAPAVRASHERWDGGGYPDRLARENIPLPARIVAACDAYDAMVTDRPYRAARPEEDARAELRMVAGIQLDPSVVDALLAELGDEPRATAS